MLIYSPDIALSLLTLWTFFSQVPASTSPPALCVERQTPSKYVCGVTGRLKDPDEANFASHVPPAKVDNMETCKALCLRRVKEDYNVEDADCLAYSFNSATKVCNIYGYPLHDGPFRIVFDVVPDENSTTVFWEQRCWKCPDGCPQQPSYNLLDNGGFERFDNITPWAPYIYNDAKFGSGFESPRALHCSDIRSSYCSYHQFFNPCLGQLYEAKFDYRVYRVDPQNPRPYISYFAGDARVTLPLSLQSNSSWQTARLIFKIYNEKIHKLEFGPFYAKGNIAYDNARVNALPLNLPAPSGPELVENGKFETGSLEPWESVCNFYAPNYCPPKRDKLPPTVRKPGINSNYAVGRPFLNKKTRFTLRQRMVLKGDTTYMFSVDYAGFGNDVSMYVALVAPGFDYDQPPLVTMSTAMPTGEGTYSRPIYVPYDTAMLYVGARAALFNDKPPPGKKLAPRLDNISVKKLY